MGKGTDLARGIIDMTKEYNRLIKQLYNEIDALRDQVIFQTTKTENQKDYFTKKIEGLEKTLETVTDIICRNISICTTDGEHYINLWEDRRDFKKLIEVLDLQLDVSKTESEEKENED